MTHASKKVFQIFCNSRCQAGLPIQFSLSLAPAGEERLPAYQAGFEKTGGIDTSVENRTLFIINIIHTSISPFERLNLLYICIVSYLSTIQEKLRQVKTRLFEKYHVNSIGLFGSIVRPDFTPESDIDIVVDFSQPIGIEFVDLANELEKLLGRKVDLVSRAGIRPQYYKAIEPDILYV